MNLDTPAHQIGWSLLIGCEIFAIAALWPLSEWASVRPRAAGFVAALAVAFTCIALDLWSFDMAPPFDPDRPVRAHGLLGWAVLPIYLAFPDAVCVASAQSLRRAGVSQTVGRAVSLAVAGLAAVVAPFAALGAGCGLAGACF